MSHSLLFQLWALILSRFVSVKPGKNPATAACPSWDPFQVQANLRSFLLFCSVMQWTEIALDNLPVILWESATEKREFQVSNNPLNASLVVQQLSIEIVSWSGSFQSGYVNCHSSGSKTTQLCLCSNSQRLLSTASAAWFSAEFNQGAANCHQVSPGSCKEEGRDLVNWQLRGYKLPVAGGEFN